MADLATDVAVVVSVAVAVAAYEENREADSCRTRGRCGYVKRNCHWNDPSPANDCGVDVVAVAVEVAEVAVVAVDAAEVKLEVEDRHVDDEACCCCCDDDDDGDVDVLMATVMEVKFADRPLSLDCEACVLPSDKKQRKQN